MSDQPVPLPLGQSAPVNRLFDLQARLERLEKALRIVIDDPGSPFASAALARAVLDGEAI